MVSWSGLDGSVGRSSDKLSLIPEPMPTGKESSSPTRLSSDLHSHIMTAHTSQTHITHHVCMCVYIYINISIYVYMYRKQENETEVRLRVEISLVTERPQDLTESH